MGKIRTTVYIDSDLHEVAKWKLYELTGNEKMISPFITLMLEEFVSEGGTVQLSLREMARAVALKQEQRYRAQQKIVQEEESAKELAEALYRERREKLTAAAFRVFPLVPSFQRCIPANDCDCRYEDEYNRTIKRIGDLSGYEVRAEEVLDLWRKYEGAKNEAV